MWGEEAEVKLGTGPGRLGRPGIQILRNRTGSKSRGEGRGKEGEREGAERAGDRRGRE